MPTSVRIALPMTSLMLLTNATAAEFEVGPYHDQYCTRCHSTEVYTRENRRVRSYAALQAQVSRCDANLATKLFPGDLSELVDYLNTNFYKFEN